MDWKRVKALVSRNYSVIGLPIILLAFTQCVCSKHVAKTDSSKSVETSTSKTQKTTVEADAGVSKPAAPKGVPLGEVLGLQDLDKDELADLESVLKDQFDPCGRPISFRESLAAKDPCERAVKMGNFLVGLVARGLSKKMMIVQYHRELKRVASRFDFDLKGSPFLGDPKSKNIIVEFTDFQCPHCERVSKPLKKLAEKYKAALYIKHLPLQIHPAARQAAIASLAAHAQGKFWDVYDLFFKNQAGLSSETIPALVKKAGVDMERFEKEVKTKALETMIQRDEAEADMAAVDGTPTIFLNGYMVEMEELEEKLGASK